MRNNAAYKEIILKLAAIYDHGDKINSTMIKFQAEHLAKWPLEEVSQAANLYMADGENKFFPRPIHAIMEYVHPRISDRDNATAISAEIWDGISKFGHCNGDRARESLGEAAWEVVTARGGWTRICDESNSSSPGIMQAQLRDLAESVLRRSKAGQLDQKIGLPGPTAQKVLDIVNQSTKSIDRGIQ